MKRVSASERLTPKPFKCSILSFSSINPSNALREMHIGVKLGGLTGFKPTGRHSEHILETMSQYLQYHVVSALPRCHRRLQSLYRALEESTVRICYTHERGRERKSGMAVMATLLGHKAVSSKYPIAGELNGWNESWGNRVFTVTYLQHNNPG